MRNTGLYPCKDCFFESNISIHPDTKVIEFKGLSLLEILGTLGGIWIVFDSFVMLLSIKLSQKIYKASLIRSLYKFNTNKNIDET